MKRPEQVLHFACVRLLGLLCSTGKLSYFHTPNAAKRSKFQSMLLNKLGVRAGVPDLIVFLPNNRVLFIELKASQGRLSEKQKMFHVELTQLGYAVDIIRSLDELRVLLGANGVKT